MKDTPLRCLSTFLSWMKKKADGCSNKSFLAWTIATGTWWSTETWNRKTCCWMHTWMPRSLILVRRCLQFHLCIAFSEHGQHSSDNSYFYVIDWVFQRSISSPFRSWARKKEERSRNSLFLALSLKWSFVTVGKQW